PEHIAANTTPEPNMPRTIAYPSRTSKLTRAATLVTLALAAIAAAPQAAAAPTDGQKFKNWAARCEQVPTGEGEQTKEQCYIFQTLAHKKTQKALLNVAVGYVADSGKPAAIFTLPLGVFLPPGLAIKIDGAEPSRLPIQLCTQEGCRGVLELTEKVVSQLKAGSEAKIAFFDARRREVVVPISLLGFTAGFNSLR
ncbi:MAG: invasion associated locus B family protein, partial [Gammaproteobacteria bacterium]